MSNQLIKKIYIIIPILFIVCFITQMLHSQTIQIDQKKKSYNLDTSIVYLCENTNKYSVDEILSGKKDHLFKKIEACNPNFKKKSIV